MLKNAALIVNIDVAIAEDSCGLTDRPTENEYKKNVEKEMISMSPLRISPTFGDCRFS